MADAVLVYPLTGFDIKKVSVDLPLSLLSAASLAARDFEIKIIDQRISPNWEDELRRELNKNPLCVGISSMTGPQITFALQAAAIARESGGDCKIVWGGVHATLLPEETVKHNLADIVVMGEGELVFRNLLNALKKKQPLESVRGIVFKNKEKIVRTEPEGPVDLNELPELPYHLVPVEEYIGSQGRFPGQNTRSLIFISSRGCPWRCAYCCNPRLSRRRWRHMSARKTYENVMKLVNTYRLDAVTFHDEEFLVDKARAEEIARLIGGRFSWWIQGRMDRLKAVDLPLLERGGLTGVQPGIESGSPRILQMVKKGESVEDMLEANRCLASTGIVPLYNFMMGFPSESHAELLETVDLALKLLEDNPKAQISGFYVFVPYPGTELFDSAIAKGFVPPQTLEGWATYNRQHTALPWLGDMHQFFQYLIFSSKLIDGTRLKSRLRAAFGGLPVPLFFCDFISRYYRRRWQKHTFRSRLDFLIGRLPLFLFSVSQNVVVRGVVRVWTAIRNRFSRPG